MDVTSFTKRFKMSQNPTENKQTLTSASIVIVVGVLATTLAQPQVLGRIPLQNLLKNELHVDRAANAAFFFWMGLAWYFKPFAGILTDALPIRGSRRKTYILISTTLATLAWFGLYFTPHEYNKLLWTCILINTFMVIASTVIGGYMVETAQACAGSGRLTAIRQFVQQVCTIINGPTAGYLASVAFGWTAAACGGVMFLLVPAALLFLYEQRRRMNSRELLDNAGKQLVKIGTAKTMWAAAGLTGLFYIAPGFWTAIFYKQQNELHLTTQGQGYLQLLGGVCGVIAAAAYAYTCRRLQLRSLLVWCLLLGTAANMGYLFYSTVGRAQIIEALNGFGYTLAELALMDLAVRATPAGSEGLGFALMMSVRNLALFGTDWFGSKLLDQYHVAFNSLVIANGITTLIAVPLVFLLPAVLVRGKDAEAPAPAPALQAAPQEI
jgi:type IV secretory pathway VirB2 component (pilin)